MASEKKIYLHHQRSAMADAFSDAGTREAVYASTEKYLGFKTESEDEQWVPTFGTNIITYSGLDLSFKGAGTFAGGLMAGTFESPIMVRKEGAAASVNIYDQDEAEYLQLNCTSGRGRIEVLGASPGEIYLNRQGNSNVTLFNDLSDGKTPFFKVFGWKSGGAKESLDISVGNTSDQQADYSGVDGHIFKIASTKVFQLTSQFAEVTGDFGVTGVGSFGGDINLLEGSKLNFSSDSDYISATGNVVSIASENGFRYVLDGSDIFTAGVSSGTYTGAYTVKGDVEVHIPDCPGKFKVLDSNGVQAFEVNASSVVTVGSVGNPYRLTVNGAIVGSQTISVVGGATLKSELLVEGAGTFFGGGRFGTDTNARVGNNVSGGFVSLKNPDESDSAVLQNIGPAGVSVMTLASSLNCTESGDGTFLQNAQTIGTLSAGNGATGSLIGNNGTIHFKGGIVELFEAN